MKLIPNFRLSIIGIEQSKKFPSDCNRSPKHQNSNYKADQRERNWHLALTSVAMIEPLEEAILVDVLDAPTTRARVPQRVLEVRRVPANPAHVLFLLVLVVLRRLGRRRRQRRRRRGRFVLRRQRRRRSHRPDAFRRNGVVVPTGTVDQLRRRRDLHRVGSASRLLSRLRSLEAVRVAASFRSSGNVQGLFFSFFFFLGKGCGRGR